ncbi:hypothetical protein CROQUDRAFT_37129, partial [Cronartium quercuum f. sp. fusiforme G11]
MNETVAEEEALIYVPQAFKDSTQYRQVHSFHCNYFKADLCSVNNSSVHNISSHSSQDFLSNFNIDDFEDVFINKEKILPGGKRRQKGRKKRITRRKGKKEDYGLYIEELLNEEELKTLDYLTKGLSVREQEKLQQDFKEGSYVCMATKYKPVAKKIRPVNQPMPQDCNPPLQRPELSRDPYLTPLTPFPPDFVETQKTTNERIKMLNFGPEGWLTEEELKLLLHVITLREKAIAYCEEERGLLKESWGMPYVIPVIDHEPWQKRPIPIPRAIKDDYIELVRERLKTGLYEQSTSSYSSPVFCVLKQDGKKLRVVHDLQELNKVTIKDAGVPPATEEFVESFGGRAIYGLGDIMGGYDERGLA